LFTFSCSYYITEQLFHDVYAAAARGAGRGLKILQRHRQGFDHPLNIFHKEGDYLTGLVCEVL
jgi:23S rRNA (cytosine1962-C5)-methyltransferase